jgi:two-component system, chemotaxis family, CheB/CheR fusion protein
MKDEAEVIPDGRFAPEDWEYILLQMVNDRSGVDFGMYRMATFRRRYLKRMNLTDASDLRGYVKLLEGDPDQLDLLVSDLLIGVTSFFRDPPAFMVLDEKVIRPLFQREDNTNIRCWITGCSNGMEAYSIAMLMDRAVAGHGGGFTVFATDISRSALAGASRGVFTQKQYETVPEDYRSYFTNSGNGFRVSRELRSRMVFSYHDVLSDPPFSRMDLVSCRNMMIYLRPRAQNMVLGRLNYSLAVGGFLFLGSGETPGASHENLETVDSRWRLFRKTSDTTLSVDMFPLERHGLDKRFSTRDMSRMDCSEDDLQARSRTFTSCLEERFFPDCVFIDEDYRILYINGSMNQYLSIPSGLPGGSVLQMLPSGLKAAVRAGVRRARGAFSRVKCVSDTGVVIHVSCVSPLEMTPVFLVEFSPGNEPSDDEASAENTRGSDLMILEEQISLLESELATTRRELRSRTGELQAANEELQTTNEEIQSANEELTASNEELMASNEELQRLNTRLETLTEDMKNLLESMDVGSLFLDERLNIRRFNPLACRFFKITDRDTGRVITDFTTTLERPCLLALLKKVAEVADTGIASQIPLDADISGHWVAKVSPYRTEKGDIRGTVITFVDITELRESELSLARSERKFRGLFSGFPLGALLVFHRNQSEEYTILDMNPAFAALMAETPDLGTSTGLKQGIVTRSPHFDFQHQNRVFSCELWLLADYAEAVCVTLKDTTDESMAESRRKELEKRLSQAQILAGMGIWEYDPSSREILLSSEAVSLCGFSPSGRIPLLEMNSYIEGFDQFHERVKASVESGQTYTDTITVHVPEGNTRYFKVSCYGGHADSGLSVYGYALDITSEVEGRVVLGQANERLAETQRMARIGVMDLTWNESLTMYRERLLDSAREILDISDASYEGVFAELMDAERSDAVLRRLKEAAANGDTVTIDVPMRNGRGDRMFVQMAAGCDGADSGGIRQTIVMTDITRRHQLENELKHSEKLRSVGELAGGIAHDFNNQLMGIVGFAECLSNSLADTEQAEFVRGILSSADRAGILVRQLLAFSRRGLSHIAPFDLHHQIEDIVLLLNRSIDRRIEIRKVFRAANPMLLGDSSEMNNALLNLALNARDAMSEGRGVITFTTFNPDPDHIRLDIRDTGRGMSKDILEKAFEPFFTTKPLGDGTGMGLSAVYGTVTAHNGTISIESEPGEGTTVSLVLPVTAVGAEEDGTLETAGSVPMEGTVLLVDDEEIVRSVLQNLLQSLGFTVITASDGVEAVKQFSDNRESIRLVLMDMTMPRMNGMEAFKEIREMAGDAKVIILSGHSAESTSMEMTRHGVKKVLQKPVLLSVLSETIREVIAGA